MGPGIKTDKSVMDEHPCGRRTEDVMIDTKKSPHKFLFEKKFKILGYTFNEAGRTQDSLEDRMQSATKADVGPSLQRILFGSEGWSWSRAILDRRKGWETKVMRRPLRFRRRILYEDSEGGRNYLDTV